MHRESGFLAWLFTQAGKQDHASSDAVPAEHRFRCHEKHGPVGNDKEVSLAVTVESADVLRVRRSIFDSAAGSVGILKATPVPHSSRVRLVIHARATAVQEITNAVMNCVDTAEFGRLARA